MKNNVIIPIFLPHEGCPNDCVFCNQKKITAKTEPLEKEAVCRMAHTYMKTISRDRIKTLEMGFFGGSFTGMSIQKQNEYLDIAQDFKNKGIIDKIRLSTRPDYIDEQILDNLKSHDVDTIELGVQSFDDEVLALSNRGHTSEAIYKSAQLIREYGFDLGVQLMIGLPGDNPEKSIDSAKKAVLTGAKIARIYPTVVIRDTKLCEMYLESKYELWTLEQMVSCAKAMCRILTDAHINVIRIGLKSTENIADGGDVLGGNYHPAFRQIVESELARDSIDEQIKDLTRKVGAHADMPSCGPKAGQGKRRFLISCRTESFSNMVGHNKSNKNYFKRCYPNDQFEYRRDDTIEKNVYVVRAVGESRQADAVTERGAL